MGAAESILEQRSGAGAEANRSIVPGRFAGQVALVVGGAQGIGRSIAHRLGLEGARVAIADIDEEMMAATGCQLLAEGCDVRTVACDVRSGSDVAQMVDSVLEWRRQIDVLMYIAGVCTAVPFVDTTEEIWDWTVDTNLKGAFLVAKAVVPHMVERRRGKLVFMSSTNSWDAEELQAPYNVSKAGVFILAKTLARELARFGINSNAVGPGFIRTRLTEQFFNEPKFMKKYLENGAIPMGRFGEADDVAGPATFLASGDADYVNGVLLLVDGGLLA